MIVAVPPFPPMFTAVVAAPPIFTVVAPVLNRFPVEEVVVKEPPLIAAFPALVISPLFATVKFVPLIN